MPFGFDVFSKSIGMSKKYVDNVVKTNKDVLGRDFTVAQKNSAGNMLSKAHQHDMVKSVHNWTGISRPAANADVVTAGQIAQMGAGMRGAMNKTIKDMDAEIEAMRKIPGSEKDISKFEKARAGMQRDKYMTYAGEGLAYGKRLMQHTFMEGSTMDRVKKTAIYGGAYMGANTAIRAAQGGGATYNANGERDIAGIPFL